MAKRPPKPKQDIDEDVLWYGPGSIVQLTEHKRKVKIKKKNPIGFIWPTEKPSDDASS